MIDISIETKENCRLVYVKMENDSMRIESGAMYYMRGNLKLEAQMPSLGGFLKSKLSSENVVRPVVSGSGLLALEPSYGDFTIFDLKGEEWILDKGAYYASEMGVSVDMWTNKLFTGLFSGEGIFQTRVSGSGKVIVHSRGPLERLELVNERLVVDGAFAVARSSTLDYSVQKATRGLFSSFISGEGLVSTFEGTGTVFIAPVQNRDMFIQNNFSALSSHISTAK